MWWVPRKTRPIAVPKHVLDMEMVKYMAKDICGGWHVKCDIKWWLNNETNKSPPIFPSILLMVFFLIKSFVCYELIEWHESIYIEMFVSIFFFLVKVACHDLIECRENMYIGILFISIPLDVLFIYFNSRPFSINLYLVMKKYQGQKTVLKI